MPQDGKIMVKKALSKVMSRLSLDMQLGTGGEWRFIPEHHVINSVCEVKEREKDRGSTVQGSD
jgi:hypothetical protein